MVIAFFGTPQFAVPTLQRLLESRHTVAGVVTQPDRPRGRGHKVSDAPVKALAVAHQLPTIQPERLKAPEFEATLRTWNIDLGVVAAYGRLIPESILAVPRLGMINVHASLLPRYRGAAPVHRAVIAGEVETGVTIMRVIKELDAGGMLARVVRPIEPDETSDVVEQGLADLGGDLLLRVVDQLDRGSAMEVAQDSALATYAPRLTREDGAIDWSRSAAAIHNQVRGLYPWPHAHTFFHGARLVVLRTKPETATASAAPGTVLDTTRDAVRVSTGSGVLRLLAVQAEGRKPMPVRDFMAGHPIRPGDVFTTT